MDMNEIRKSSLRRLITEHGREPLSEILGCTPGYLSQLTGDYRPISEKTARKYEHQLQLPTEWMDIDHDAVSDALAPVEARQLIDVMLSLPPADRAFWMRMIQDRPRS